MTYYYKATNTSGKIETGTLDVGSKPAALERLEKMVSQARKRRQPFHIVH